MLVLAVWAVNFAWWMDEEAIEEAAVEREADLRHLVETELARLDADLAIAVAFVDRGLVQPSSDAKAVAEAFSLFVPSLPMAKQGVLRALWIGNDAIAFSWSADEDAGDWVERRLGAWQVRARIDWPALFSRALAVDAARDLHLGVRRAGDLGWIYLQHAHGKPLRRTIQVLERSGRVIRMSSSWGVFELVVRPSRAFAQSIGHPRTWLATGGGIVTFVLIALWLQAEARVRAAALRRRQIARAMLDAIPFPISFLDRDARYVEFNQALARFVGRSFSEIKRATPAQIWGEEVWKEEIEPHFRRALAGAIVEHEFQHAGRCYLGTFIPWRERDEVRGVIVVTRDITEQKQREKERIAAIEQRERARRWEDLGHIAGGVAHDLNNMLGAIVAAIEHAMETPKEVQRRELLHSALHGCEQAGRLCRQLLVYAGKGGKRREKLHPGVIVRDAVRLLEPARPPDVRLIVDVPRLLPTIEGDRADLVQALFNLGLNALQVVDPRKGLVRITVKALGSDAIRWQRDDRPAPDQVVVFSVEDNGPGVDPELRDRLFTPFFTTKEEGTGMGLAVVAGVARAHGGFVDLNSIPGDGASFEIVLPAEGEWVELAEEDRQQLRRSVPARTHQVALVVDDEQVLRRLNAMGLKKLGFEVIEASDGEEAVKIVESRKDLAFVLMDVRMPRMDGVEAMRRMRKLAPELPIVLVSGAASDPVELSKDAPNAWLNKPFRFAELEDALRRLGVLS